MKYQKWRLFRFGTTVDGLKSEDNRDETEIPNAPLLYCVYNLFFIRFGLILLETGSFDKGR